jgi:hypothetical protein
LRFKVSGFRVEEGVIPSLGVGLGSTHEGSKFWVERVLYRLLSSVEQV